ncbi:CPCC family cysteine-rich protein [Chitinophaga sp.]|uniref:CPCC family cysteine-rich protein n=1 Tax=Chitinophaga sp. TaxID=1869181 RepID=UPI0031D1C6D9
MPDQIFINREDAMTLFAWQKLLTMHPKQRRDIVAEILVEAGKADEEIEDANVEAPEYNHDIINYLREGLLNVTNEFIEEDLKELYHHEVSIEGGPLIYEPCPCCGYRTIASTGVYNVCPNCYWEDDGNRDPQAYSAVNHLILQEGRDNYNSIGSCDPTYLEYVNKHPNKYLKA